MARMVTDRIDDALYKKLKLKAAQAGVTVRSLIVEAIEKLVGGKK